MTCDEFGGNFRLPSSGNSDCSQIRKGENEVRHSWDRLWTSSSSTRVRKTRYKFTLLQLLYYLHLVKFSRYRPGVAQRVGRGIALLFHDRGTRRGWVVNRTPRPHFTPGKDSVPIVQEAGWAPGPVWTGGKSRPHRDSIPDRPARSQSLYRLSYRAHTASCRGAEFQCFMKIVVKLPLVFNEVV